MPRLIHIPVRCAHTSMKATKDCLPHPLNANVHTAEQIRLLAGLLQTQGWRVPVTISKLSGRITAGHGRIMAANRLKLESVPVDEQDYASEDEEIADCLADNFLANLSVFDTGALDKIIAGDAKIDPETFGISGKELERFRKEWGVGVEDITLISEYDPADETYIAKVPGIKAEHRNLIVEKLTSRLSKFKVKVVAR